MKLAFNETQLLELMKDFYILTGIRIVLFDDEYQELLSYPSKDCRFCTRIKQLKDIGKHCMESDRSSFQQCKTERRLIIYHCHAGLIEATVPLIDNHIVIGYLMFGQISDAADLNELKELVFQGDLASHRLDLEEMLCEIPLKKREQIHAAAKIMDACTFYALMNETIAIRCHNFTTHLTEYLIPHLREPLTSETIARDLGISRSKLYSSCDKYLGMGIAEYIRTLRLEQAQKLLKESDLSITQISDSIGFEDYNYFCRVFKKETGYSAKKYREMFKK